VGDHDGPPGQKSARGSLIATLGSQFSLPWWVDVAGPLQKQSEEAVPGSRWWSATPGRAQATTAGRVSGSTSGKAASHEGQI
jgi:hypothetical protein